MITTDTAGKVGFVADFFVEVNEDDENAIVLVERIDGSLGAASITISTEDIVGENAATAGLDYVAKTQTLTWLDGQMGVKVRVDIYILLRALPLFVQCERSISCVARLRVA